MLFLTGCLCMGVSLSVWQKVIFATAVFNFLEM